MRIRRRDTTQWHRWFAWWPIEFVGSHLLWLAWVERRAVRGFDGLGEHLIWQYRELTPVAPDEEG